MSAADTGTDTWLDTVPTLTHFSQCGDASLYTSLPDDWFVGVSDVVDSASAIAAGHYKAVNLAGAGTISSVSNALDGGLRLFVFGGDGAHFAISPQQKPVVEDALTRVSAWATRELELSLRVALVQVADIRSAGLDVRVAFWRASDDVRYAMFTGGGLEWAEAAVKAGKIGLLDSALDKEPDLTGLSCQWGPLKPQNGTILSLIIKQHADADNATFNKLTSQVIKLLDQSARLNPVPQEGPDVTWPAKALILQSRISYGRVPFWLRQILVRLTAGMIWLIFKTNLHISGFDPDRYRREIATNTDFRKFDDGLMMTIDCSAETITKLQILLEEAKSNKVVRYGLHTQQEALITCVAPTVRTSDHMHFVDGAGGGYASAARQMQT
ncbi:MAG: DUF3095 domain-containing protein [Rhizobiaceae bacterium]